jgi:hypothetical protein
VILDVDPGVSLPGRFVNSVAATFLPGITELGVAYLAEVLKSDPFRIASHLSDNPFNLRPGLMKSLLILLSRGESVGCEAHYGARTNHLI